MSLLLYFPGILTLAILLYLTIIRPCTLAWGTTKEEFRRALPGDDMVQKTHFVANIMMRKCMLGIKLRAEKRK